MKPAPTKPRQRRALRSLVSVLTSAVFGVMLIPRAYAIPPPDIIFQGGALIGYAITILIALFGGLWMFFRKNIGKGIQALRTKKLLGIGVVTAIAVLVVLKGPFFTNWVPATLIEEYSLERQSSAPAISVSEAITMWQKEEAIFIDVRELEERSEGFIPESLHIRYADLLSGTGMENMKGQTVVVLCYTGSRAEEIAEKLQGNGIESYSMEGGLREWKREGHPFTGKLGFSSNLAYQKKHTLSAEEALRYIEEGSIMIDTRKAEYHDWWNVPGSISLPLFQMTSSQLEEALETIPAGK